MEEFKKEILLEKYPKPISIEGTKKILNQMENNICKVYKNDGGKGTGFFCYIIYNNQKISVMMTNNHIIDEAYIKENDTIKITINDDKIIRTINLNDNRITYTNEEYDTTIVEIKPEKDYINNFMEIDDNIYKEESDILYKNHSVYIIQYPNSDKASVSYGIMNKIIDFNIHHYCCTDSGSSGSPIINLLNNKIIGIHKEGSIKFQINKATFLKYPINEFLNIYKDENITNKRKESFENINNNLEINDIKNELEIKIKINKQDINKKIYFLDNADYIESKSHIKHFHDNLKELNKSNVDLYINNYRYQFEKYFIPDNEGIYKIKLKFKIYIKDCSFMFAGCKNIININFKNFNTKNTINMKYMFTGCTNIESLDLSSFNTKNVIDMEGMFGQYNNLPFYDLSSFELSNLSNDFGKNYFDSCEKLKEINLSSFDTKNVTNMSFMFGLCKNLSNLNLSSFNTKNVTNMSCMFFGCNNLINLDLSFFITKNVTNMLGMFYICFGLINLDLSSFDTIKVTNFSHMFFCCNNLINLNISSFKTKNATNMSHMFYGCNNLINLDLSSFDIKNVDNAKEIFTGCEKISTFKIPSRLLKLYEHKDEENCVII